MSSSGRQPEYRFDGDNVVFRQTEGVDLRDVTTTNVDDEEESELACMWKGHRKADHRWIQGRCELESASMYVSNKILVRT